MGERRGSRRPSPLTVPLLRWFQRHRRPLPWRTNRNPYRIWVAEVMLQQTRVAQAAPYYRRFVRRFPTLASLAIASEQEVLKVWEGAGYYARARNLRRAARTLYPKRGGLPHRVEDLERLPGIGPYIARAVASLAYDAPVLAIEANGLRVASRLTLELGDIRRPLVRRRLVRFLEASLPLRRAGAFNESLMELGETVCLLRTPRCAHCPLARHCRARHELPEPGLLPLRSRRALRPRVRAAVIALEQGGRWLVQRRPSDGLLGGLWEFPGGKIDPGESAVAAARRELREETGLELRELVPVGVIAHDYSHFHVDLTVFRVRLPGRSRLPVRRENQQRWLTPAQFARLPRPAATRKVVHLLRRSPTPGAFPGSGSRSGHSAVSAPSEGPRPLNPARKRGSGSSATRLRVPR